MTSIEDDRKHLGPDGVSARKSAVEDAWTDAARQMLASAPASADLDALEQAARAAIIGEIVTLSPDDLLRLIAAVREADALRTFTEDVLTELENWVSTSHIDRLRAEYAALSPTEPSGDRDLSRTPEDMDR